MAEYAATYCRRRVQPNLAKRDGLPGGEFERRTAVRSPPPKGHLEPIRAGLEDLTPERVTQTETLETKKSKMVDATKSVRR